MDVLAFAAVVVVGYVLGTVPSAVIVTRLATGGRVDIRATGSGNPGGFNTFRSVGPAWGVVVILADGGKALLAGVLGLVVAGDAGAYGAATAAIAGHIWPVFLHFRGGKGMATAGGAVLAVFPAFFLIELVVLGLGVLAFRRALPTMLAGMAAWAAAAVVWAAADWPNAWGPAPGAGLVVFSVLGAAMVVTKFVLAAREVAEGA